MIASCSFVPFRHIRCSRTPSRRTTRARMTTRFSFLSNQRLRPNSFHSGSGCSDWATGGLAPEAGWEFRQRQTHRAMFAVIGCSLHSAGVFERPSKRRGSSVRRDGSHSCSISKSASPFKVFHREGDRGGINARGRRRDAPAASRSGDGLRRRARGPHSVRLRVRPTGCRAVLPLPPG